MVNKSDKLNCSQNTQRKQLFNREKSHHYSMMYGLGDNSWLLPEIPSQQ